MVLGTELGAFAADQGINESRVILKEGFINPAAPQDTEPFQAVVQIAEGYMIQNCTVKIQSGQGTRVKVTGMSCYGVKVLFTLRSQAPDQVLVGNAGCSVLVTVASN